MSTSLSVVQDVPAPVRRRIYALRGIVERSEVVTTGRLWWRESHPTLTIRLRADQVREFNRLAQETMSVQGDRPFKGIEPSGIITAVVPQELLAQFPVNSQVGVTFEYAGPINQFFLGQDVLRLIKVEPVTEQAVLEYEVEIYLLERRKIFAESKSPITMEMMQWAASRFEQDGCNAFKEVAEKCGLQIARMLLVVWFRRNAGTWNVNPPSSDVDAKIAQAIARSGVWQ